LRCDDLASSSTQSLGPSKSSIARLRYEAMRRLTEDIPRILSGLRTDVTVGYGSLLSVPQQYSTNTFLKFETGATKLNNCGAAAGRAFLGLRNTG
jgi:hypothetical protein